MLEYWGIYIEYIWQNTGYYTGKLCCMTRLDWVEYSTQSVWNVWIKFYTWKEHLKLSVIEGKTVVMSVKQCWYKTMYN